MRMEAVCEIYGVRICTAIGTGCSFFKYPGRTLLIDKKITRIGWIGTCFPQDSILIRVRLLMAAGSLVPVIRRELKSRRLCFV